MKFLAVIPARSGSKSIKDKNIILYKKKPLICHSIQTAIKSKIINRVIVSTDSEKYKKIAVKCGAEVPFLRPKKLSGDLITTEATLKYSLLKYEEIKKKKFDICVFLTATDIFRKVSWITKSVKILKSNKKLESVFSGYKTHKNFWELKNNKWIRLRSWMRNYSSRQIRRYIVREDTGIACASRAYLWRNGKRIGDKVEIIQNNAPFTSIDIHEPIDLKMANFAMKIWKRNLYK